MLMVQRNRNYSHLLHYLGRWQAEKLGVCFPPLYVIKGRWWSNHWQMEFYKETACGITSLLWSWVWGAQWRGRSAPARRASAATSQCLCMAQSRWQQETQVRSVWRPAAKSSALSHGEQISLLEHKEKPVSSLTPHHGKIKNGMWVNI